ncbi:unnamed protein product [Spirodela intermedia]|uniref:Uncharacterized protein n=1 Tax=Spirodela intermedia TaxID=51605 RepID=A0A7I8I9H0_SPIIN|nr:unnamed protein product [Spirodela intermedia]CAA6654346.1 unnamed protein product [Spirodela intermedia]
MKTPDTSWWRNGEGDESKSSASPSLMAVLATVLAVSIVFYWFRRVKNEARLLPPGPEGCRCSEIARTYGPVVSLRLGGRLCVLLSSPHAVKEALKDQDAIFANHDAPAASLFSPYGGKNMLYAPYGPQWRILRKVTVRQLLNPATIDGLSVPRQAEIRRMVEEIRGKAGQPVNLRELISAAAMNMTTEMLWGGSLAQRGDDRDALGGSSVRRWKTCLARPAGPGEEDAKNGLIDRLHLQFSHRGAVDDDGGLSGRRPGGGRGHEKQDFLQVMLDLVQNPDPQAPITMDHMKALLLDLVTGGTDTTSTTLEWAMAELLYDPERMKTAKEEIVTVVGVGNAVEETLRLHPAVPLLVPHRPSSTCTVAGYKIPEGTKVFINVWAIHRDPRVWEDASEFKPERFLREAGGADYSGNTFRYLPFGAGRRICPGISLGEGIVASPDLNEKFGIVMRKEKTLVAVPTLRIPQNI